MSDHAQDSVPPVDIDATRPQPESHHVARSFLRWASSYATGGCAFDRMPAEMQQVMLDTAEATMGDLDGGTGEHITLDQVAAIPCPVTCLLGDLTTPAIADATHRIVKAHPAAQLVTIRGAGHAIPFDRPREFVSAVLAANQAATPAADLSP